MCRDGLQRWFICRSKISRERTASIINREDWDLEIHDRKQTRRALSNTPRVLNLLAIAEPQIGVDQELSCTELGSATRKQAHPTQRNSEVEEQEFCKTCETAYKRCCASSAESYIHAHRCLILVHGVYVMHRWVGGRLGPFFAGACH